MKLESFIWDLEEVYFKVFFVGSFKSEAIQTL